MTVARNMNEKQYDKHVRVRSFLINNLDIILENIAARRERKKHDTEDIFSILEDDSSTGIHWKRDIPLKTNMELLMIEKESLGVYMSGNPLEDFEHIRDAVRFASGLGNNLHLAIVEKVKKIFTKSQNMMFALQLTLPDSQIEGVIFSKKAMEYSSILVEKELYWIIGRVDEKKSKSRDSISLETPNEGDNLTYSENENLQTVELSEDKPVAEFVEKPKLLISHIARFETGLKEFFKSYENPAPDSFLSAIPSTDWLSVKADPLNCFDWSESDIYNMQRQIPSGGFVKARRTYPPRKNFSKTEAYKESAIENIHGQNNGQDIYNSNPESLNIFLNQDLSPEIIKFVKGGLLKQEQPDSVPVSLLVQKDGQYKKVKGDFWMLQTHIAKIPHLLQT